MEFDPPNAAPGSRIVYRVEISALEESLTLPDKLPLPAGLELKAGGRGQTYVPTGNMKLRPQSTVIFRGIAPVPGTYTIPAYTLMAYGKAIPVPAATLTVAAPGIPADPEAPRVLVQLPATDCYVGQLLSIPLLLPTQGDNAPFGFSHPQIRGDFIFSESIPTGMRQQNLQLEGKNRAVTAQDVLITPLRAGTLELIGQVQSLELQRSALQPGVMQAANVFIDSEPAKLEIKPLPLEGVLPGFNGAVGNFTIDPPVLSARRLKVGEPLTLTVVVRGEGNLGRLAPPPLPTVSDWQCFLSPAEPTPAAVAWQRGFVSFNFVFIPLNSKSTQTPAIPFSAFDPVKKRYINLTIPGVSVQIDPGLESRDAQKEAVHLNAANSDLERRSGVEKKAVFTGIVKNAGAAKKLKPLQQSWRFQLGQLVPAGIIAGLYFASRRRRHLELHPEILVKRKARRDLRREQKVIYRAVAAKDQPAFTLAAARALRIACAPHQTANPAALVCADVLRELRKTEQVNGQGELVRTIFQAADDLRFAKPPSYDRDLLALQAEVNQLLGELKERL